MVQDPKQIVTPFAFDVHEDLLGLPLATPKRRFAALMLDLVFASLLSSLGAYILAGVASVLFFWLAVRWKGKSWFRYILRFGTAVFASVLVFAVTFHYTKSEDDFDKEDASQQVAKELGKNTNVVAPGTGNVDWTAFSKRAMSIDYSDEEKAGEAWEELGRELEKNIGVLADTDDGDNEELYSEAFRGNLLALSSAIERDDSAAVDSLREVIVPVIAAMELNNLDREIDEYKSENDELEDRVEALQEKVDNPLFMHSVKAIGADFGLNFGWIGIYFILSLALFKGRTLGKKMLSLQVVRLNNEPIGLWYSFERFGGYAAGLVTGLLGFFQVYWDPNRQGIHDKIAATVVVDLREKKRQKTEVLRSKVFKPDEDSM